MEWYCRGLCCGGIHVYEYNVVRRDYDAGGVLS